MYLMTFFLQYKTLKNKQQKIVDYETTALFLDLVKLKRVSTVKSESMKDRPKRVKYSMINTIGRHDADTKRRYVVHHFIM
jgi:hypothetical protein